MASVLAYAGQAVFYAGVAAAVGIFASWPTYGGLPDGAAQVKLSFIHSGARAQECHRLSVEELAKLPTSERRPIDCSRKRLPVTVQLSVDGRSFYEATLEPGGFWGDGPVKVYEKFTIPAGQHRIEAKLRDSKRDEGFDYETGYDAGLAPGQNLAIDFKAEQGGFLFR
jgi:hypothetical protein